MEKKEEDFFSPNPEPEFKNNRICCLTVKTWTSVVGWTGLAFILWIGVAGTVSAFAFGVNDIFDLEHEQNRTPMTARQAYDFCKPLWMICFLGILFHAKLLIGNAMDERISLVPWLTITWAWLFIKTEIFAESDEPPSCDTVLKLLVYWLTMGFALYVVHRRYNEISAWDRKMIDLEKYMEDEISV